MTYPSRWFGSFAPDDVRELAQRYLGNLPGSGMSETWVDRDLPFPDEIRARDVYAGLEEQVIFLLAYGGAYEGDKQDAAAMRALGDIVAMRAVEDLREDLSGTYSPYASASVNEIPRRSFILQSVFYTNPEKYEALRAATFAILADLRANGPTEEEVESVRAQRLNNLQEAREENSYWLGSLRRVMIGVEDDYGLHHGFCGALGKPECRSHPGTGGIRPGAARPICLRRSSPRRLTRRASSRAKPEAFP